LTREDLDKKTNDLSRYLDQPIFEESSRSIISKYKKQIWHSLKYSENYYINNYGAKDIDERKIPAEVYTIPIFYHPHFDNLALLKISNLIYKFFQKISIKDNSYEQLNGPTHSLKYTFYNVSEKNGKERIEKKTINFNFRNEATVDLINLFSISILKNSVPDNLNLQDNVSEFKCLSFYFSRNDTPAFFSSEYLIGLNIKTQKINQELNLTIKSKENYSFFYFPKSLIYFNLTETELSKIKKIKLAW
jgi:hypothetical protein